MVYDYVINGYPLKSGDIISTKDGNNSIYSLGYALLGQLVPGKVDHTVIYVGPEGLCVEAGMRGVISFQAESQWDSNLMFRNRGLVDTFFTASSALSTGKQTTDEQLARAFIRGYILGSVGKPYNFNFLDPDTEYCVYCSQLAYLAYKKIGIDLNEGTAGLPGVGNIVFPADILGGTTIISKTD